MYYLAFNCDKNLIKYNEENQIAIRIFINQKSNFNGFPFIGTARVVDKFLFWKSFKAQYIPLGMAFITLFLGLTYLIQYLMDLNMSL